MIKMTEDETTAEQIARLAREVGYYKCAFEQEERAHARTLRTLNELQDRFDAVLSAEHGCSKCGREMTMGEVTQGDTCDSCWNEQLRMARATAGIKPEVAPAFTCGVCGENWLEVNIGKPGLDCACTRPA